MKQCSMCQKIYEDPKISFHKDANTSDGLHGNCKECRNPVEAKRAKQWFQKNKEKRKKYGRMYYRKNRERCIASSTKWQKENREKFNQQQKEYRTRKKALINL